MNIDYFFSALSSYHPSEMHRHSTVILLDKSARISHLIDLNKLHQAILMLCYSK